MLNISDGTFFGGQCPEGEVGECLVPVNPEKGHQATTELLDRVFRWSDPLIVARNVPGPTDPPASHRLWEGLPGFQRWERNTADSSNGAEGRMRIAMETTGPRMDFNGSL